MVPPALDVLVSSTTAASPTLAQGIPAGPEVLILLLVYGVFAFVPLIATLVALYLLYGVRNELRDISESLDRIAEGEGRDIDDDR